MWKNWLLHIIKTGYFINDLNNYCVAFYYYYTDGFSVITPSCA